MKDPIGVIMQLQSTSGKNAKLKILEENKDNDVLRRILVYSVDPKRKFHIRKLPDDLRGEGTGIISKQTWRILNQLADRSLSGNAARTALCGHIRSLRHNDAVIVKRIVKKRMQIGIAEATIRAIWPDEVPSRDLQKGEDWDPSRFVPGSYAGLKLDGLRGEFREGGFYTFGDHYIPGLDRLIDIVHSHWPHAHVDGELIIEGMDFDSMSGAIRAGRGDELGCRFAVFDTLATPELPQSARLDIVGANFPPYLSALERVGSLGHVVVNSVTEVDDLYRNVILLGHEGLVIKTPNDPHYDGRNYWWMKRKKGWEGELYVVGVYEGEDDLHGTLGGVVVQVSETVTTRVGSGFPLDKRHEYWADPTKVIGKLATIVAMEKNKFGRLRHAVWKGLRRDLI